MSEFMKIIDKSCNFIINESNEVEEEEIIQGVKYDNDNNILENKRKLSNITWGENIIYIVNETDFSNERQAVIVEGEDENMRRLRLKETHKARLLDNRKINDINNIS
jgi:hypothetical protein